MSVTSETAVQAARIVYVSESPLPTVSDLELFAGYPDLLTPAHLSEITGQCEATMRAMCARGDLPAVRIGKRWYVPKPSMVEYVAGGGDGN